ncbi:hypothetical protein XANCAGTX0491_001337 [Xanthoria calcicola]
MLLLSAAILLASFVCLRVSQASPLAHAQTAPPAAPNIQENAEDRRGRPDRLTPSGVNCWIAKDPDCWVEMEMDKYVTAWMLGPSGRVCGTQGIPEGFGDCFIRLHEMGVICSQISRAACGAEISSKTDQLTSSELVPGKVPITDLERRQAFLAATNIVAMNVFFNTWHDASEFAFSETSAKVTQIITTAAPPPESTQDALKSTIINALLAGLAFIPGLSTGGNILSTAARTVRTLEAPGRALLTASSTVYGRIFATDGSAESNLVNIGKLQSSLSDFKDSFKQRLGPALYGAINNETEFLAMANTGAFSAEFPPRIENATAGLESALTTYLVSVALGSAGWYGVVAPNTNVDALLSGQLGEVNVDYGCSAVDPVIKQCHGKMWHDIPNNQGFTMVQGHSFLNNPYDQFWGFFGNPNGHVLTTPEQLLVGAARCRQRPNWGSVGITFENGEMNFDCLSQLKICTYNYEYVQWDGAGNKYLEADCPTEEGFGYDRNRYETSSDYSRTSHYAFVEPGYMGPMRTGHIDEPLKTTSGEP